SSMTSQRKGSRRPSNVALFRMLLEGPRDFFGCGALDDVVRLHAFDPLDADAALEPLEHLADIVLEALERGHGALAEQGVASLDSYPRRANDLALDDRAAIDRAHLGAGEELLHLGSIMHRLADLAA